MKEQWKPVGDFVGLYEVSNLGRVRSLARTARCGDGFFRSVRERILKTHLARGYPSVSLKRGGEEIAARVHRLVAAAFIGPCPLGKEVAHADGNRQNAAVSNLRYATRKENEFDKIKHGKRNVGARNGRAVLSDEDILEIRRRVAAGEMQKHLVKEFSTNSGHVSEIINRKVWCHI